MSGHDLDRDRSGRRPPRGRSSYVPSTRVGRDEPRRTSIGSQSRGGSRPVPRQGRNSRYKSEQNYRTLSGRDTGYSLKGHKQKQLNFEKRHGGLLSRYGISNRMLALIAALVVIILIIVLGISSCVRGANEKAKQEEEEVTSTNQWDSRVADGIDQDLTGKFSSELDRNEKLANIAKNANRYSDTRMLELALAEPEAIDFVAAYPDAEHQASDYGSENKEGDYPLLYDWDSRWGSADYAGSAIAVTGSGPTAFAMAYMGLTGDTGKTPATFASDATDKNYTTTDTIGTTGDLFTYEAEQNGLSCKQYSTPSSKTLEAILETKGTVVIVQLKKGLGNPDAPAHWALVVSQNEDGSVTLYDPTSSQNSNHTWSVGSIAKSSNSFYALSKASSDESGESEGSDSSGDSSKSSDSSDSGSSSNKTSGNSSSKASDSSSSSSSSSSSYD